MPDHPGGGSGDQSRDWLNVLSTCLGLALTLYLVWEMVPAIRLPVQAQFSRLIAQWQRRKAREREIASMAWETYLVRSLMEVGKDDLAIRLEVAGAGGGGSGGEAGGPDLSGPAGG